VDESEDVEREAEVPDEPPTERVRIIGAQPAGAVTGQTAPPESHGTDATLPPAVGGPPGAGDRETPGAASRRTSVARTEAMSFGWPEEREEEPPGSVGEGQGADAGAPDAEASTDDAPASVEASAVTPELLHWSDPPTGQVPAVLDRRNEEGEGEGVWAASGDTGPVWREHHHEWDDSSFEPSLLADDQTRVGALEETPVEERRPWEFDDLRAAPGEGPGPANQRAGEGNGSFWGDEPDVGASDAAAAPEVAAAPVTQRPSRSPIPPPPGPPGVASISSSPLRLGGETPHGPVGRARGPRTRVPAGGGAGRDMPVAIATGVGFAILAVLCFKLGSVATLALSTLVVTLAAAECYAALRRSGRHPATLLGLVGTVMVMVAAYVKGVAALPLVTVLVVIAAMVLYLVGAERGSPTEGIAATVLAFVWVGLLGSFAALILAPSQYPARHGVAFLLGAVVATIGADVGALAVGSWLGRHPLAPRISPNKTWEGFAGGAVLAVVLSVAVTGQVHPWTMPKAALLGLVVAVVAPVGDLCESLVKRDLGLKDMGSILPGHGGILDRVDALLFVLPATYYLVRVLHLG